jgi:DNA-binding HxlR family transcriptional regulator
MGENADTRFLNGWYNARLLIAAEWTPAIMCSLAPGPLHYGDILTAVRSTTGGAGREGHRMLHDSILARSLRRLVDDGLIHRDEQRTQFPPSVRYSLTAAGHDLLGTVRVLADWSTRHPDLVAQALLNHGRSPEDP